MLNAVLDAYVPLAVANFVWLTDIVSPSNVHVVPFIVKLAAVLPVLFATVEFSADVVPGETEPKPSEPRLAVKPHTPGMVTVLEIVNACVTEIATANNSTAVINFRSMLSPRGA